MFKEAIPSIVCFSSLLQSINFYPMSYHLTVFLNLWFMGACIRFTWGMWEVV